VIAQKKQSMSLPFKPATYRSYQEAINGLYRQNAAGFFKGNGIRSVHIVLFHKLNADLNVWAEATYPAQWKALKAIPCAQEFLLTCTLDCLLQPLFVAETRFMLQNRHPNFAVYQSTTDLFRRSWKELYRGMTANIPRNFFIALSKYFH
jgi:hypothetical protein